MSLLRHILSRRAPLWHAHRKANVFTTRWSSSEDTVPLDLNTALARPEEMKHRKKLSDKITVPKAVDLSPISGVPPEQIKQRSVRIHIPAKNAMQSGTNNLHTWQIEFDNRGRWENPLMGWASTGDPLSNMILQFGTQDEAINYCERNGWRWYVDSEVKPKKQRFKSYGINFSFNKRTRLSTK